MDSPQSHGIRVTCMTPVGESNGGRTASWQSWRHVIPTQKQDCSPSASRGQSIKPKKIILRPWRLIKFAPSGFGLTWDLSPLSSFQFLPLGMGMSIFSLPHHYIWEAHSSLVSWFTAGGVCIRVSHTWSLTHIWSRHI